MLNQKEINKIASKIRDKIKPQKIYLFGSYASGKATEKSDLDLLIVDDSNRNKNSLALEISKMLFPRKFGLELIVTSPSDLQKKQQLNLSFWKNILKTGKKLYERN